MVRMPKATAAKSAAKRAKTSKPPPATIRLPSEQANLRRQAVHMYVNGMTVKEVADELGVKLGEVQGWVGEMYERMRSAKLKR